ncbi:MAG: hypothetical protein JO257_08515 [Deltaproteobacteria bacterium]|nr:hypothetical protein [Deltaproteobacteria bacterium]
MQRSLVFVAMGIAAACTGDIEDKSLQGLTPAEALAKTRWLKDAEPVFQAKCFMCHDGSMAAANPVPDPYLAGSGDMAIRDTAVAYVPQLVNLGAPKSSRVLSKGMHEGPALTAQEATKILGWIEAERDARTPAMVIETMQVMMTDGSAATVPLDSVGAVGATLTFTAQTIAGGVYMTNLKVTAGADGVYFAHPLFVSNPPGAGSGSGSSSAIPDPLDRYYSTTVNVGSNGSASIGMPATFDGFSIASPISVRFDVVDKYRPGT